MSARSLFPIPCFVSGSAPLSCPQIKTCTPSFTHRKIKGVVRYAELLSRPLQTASNTARTAAGEYSAYKPPSASENSGHSHAIGAKQPLRDGALRAPKRHRRGLIPNPSKMAFYCVTYPLISAPIKRRGAVVLIDCRPPFFQFVILSITVTNSAVISLSNSDICDNVFALTVLSIIAFNVVFSSVIFSSI